MNNTSHVNELDKPGTGKQKLLVAAGLFALFFGGLTIFSGGSVLFGNDETRAAAGNYVAWVLWFNFLSGFIYVLTGYGIMFKRVWAAKLAWVLAGAIIIAAIGFAIHIVAGDPFEMRTAGAMTLRTVVWIVIAAMTSRFLFPGKQSE